MKKFSVVFFVLVNIAFLAFATINMCFLLLDKTIEYSLIARMPYCLLVVLFAFPLIYFFSKTFGDNNPEWLKKAATRVYCFLIISFALFLLGSFKTFPSGHVTYDQRYISIVRKVEVGRWYHFPPTDRVLFFPD